MSKWNPQCRSLQVRRSATSWDTTDLRTTMIYQHPDLKPLRQVGWGMINGNTHAFLATPCDTDQTDSQCRDISVADDKRNDTALVPTTANVSDLREVRSRFGRRGALLEGSR